jgi:DNA-binding FadR family transcriptional regulator
VSDVRQTFAEDDAQNGDAGAELRDVSEASALAQLRAFIANGGYVPGSRLPSERSLGTDLGLRRSELRKALERLEREGVLWRHVGKGTFLSNAPDQSNQNDLTLLSRKVSPADVMQARATIEPAIAREAALHASGSAIQALRFIVVQSRGASTWREYETHDNEFHRAIAEMSGSVTLLALFDQLNTLRRMMSWGRLARNGPHPPSDHPSYSEHDGIVDALEARDPDGAQDAMRRHLQSVQDRLFR